MEFLSEIILAIFIILNIILSMFLNRNSYKFSKLIAILALIICTGVELFQKTNIFQLMILLSAFLVIFSTPNLIREKRNRNFEYFSIFLSGILASFCLINSNNFISAFVSIETLSISCYFLTGCRKNHKSKEASLKYLITGATSSSIMLLGISYLWGLSGNINFSEINQIFQVTEINILFNTSCLLILFGTMFKLGCIPFINWVSDIFEGSNYQTCLYLSLIPKISTIAFLINLFNNIFKHSALVLIFSAILALITIIYASIGSIKQINIKKIYAYSTIIHAGFILLAISTTNLYSTSTIIFYLLTYLFMNAGIWYASIIYNSNYKTDNIEDYKGLFKKHPYFSTAFIINLISLAGLPPTAGFLAKIYLFSAIFKNSTIWQLILLLTMLTTILCVFVYFKIAKQLFLNSNSKIIINKQNQLSKIVLYICSIITILLCIYPDYFIKLSQFSAYYR